MPKHYEYPEILPPAPLVSRPTSKDLERKESEFARTAAQLDKIALKEHLLLSEIRGPVSSRNNYYEIDRLESFADRLIQANVRKQAKPDIVARNIRRSSRLLADLPRDTPRTKRFDTAYVTSRRVDLSPRTVFGTDAWTRTSSSMRRQFINKVLALPCIERTVRREVIFAKGKGHKGHRVPHRPAKFSDIWC